MVLWENQDKWNGCLLYIHVLPKIAHSRVKNIHEDKQLEAGIPLVAVLLQVAGPTEATVVFTEVGRVFLFSHVP